MHAPQTTPSSAIGAARVFKSHFKSATEQYNVQSLKQSSAVLSCPLTPACISNLQVTIENAAAVIANLSLTDQPFQAIREARALPAHHKVIGPELCCLVSSCPEGRLQC